MMGKRSSFERIAKDFYRTIDRRAAEALAPHIEEGARFVEACAGAGDLLEHLEEIPLRCIEAWDIDPKGPGIIQTNALNEWANGMKVDYFITNPPWSRPILHELIEHLSAQLPTWLLFDADWAHTKQAQPYLKYCRKIVSVGRLKWIPGTTMSGKDNCAWYLFDQNDACPTEFINRRDEWIPIGNAANEVMRKLAEKVRGK